MPRYDIRPSSRERKDEARQKRQETSLKRRELDIAETQAGERGSAALLGQMADLVRLGNEQQLQPEKLRQAALANQAAQFNLNWAQPLQEQQFARGSTDLDVLRQNLAEAQATQGVRQRGLEAETSTKEIGAQYAGRKEQAGLDRADVETGILREKLPLVRPEILGGLAAELNTAQVAPNIQLDVFSGRNPALTLEKGERVSNAAKKGVFLEDTKRDPVWFLDEQKRAMALELFGQEGFNNLVNAAYTHPDLLEARPGDVKAEKYLRPGKEKLPQGIPFGAAFK